jgi:3-dehydroquinate dehydratase type I
LKPKICVTIPAITTEKVLETIKALNQESPDIIEIRLDYSTEIIHPAIFRKATSIPLIATCRDAGQGGQWKSNENYKLHLLLEAAESGYEYIDIESDAPKMLEVVNIGKMNGSKIILSNHNFNTTHKPEELDKILSQTLEIGVSICKVVGTAIRYEDNLTYLGWLGNHPGNVAFAMGQYGIPSRVVSALVGGVFTYASTKRGEESALGQPTFFELREIYKSMGVQM